jgi:hypothetical protein
MLRTVPGYFLIGMLTLLLGIMPSSSSGRQNSVATGVPPESVNALFATPRPQVVKISPPGKNVPKSQAALSGMWAGTWSQGYGAGLIVEYINSAGFTVIYSWGTSEWFNKGWARTSGRFVDGKLHVKVRGATVTYRMRTDGMLDAEWSNGFNEAYATLTKIYPASP